MNGHASEARVEWLRWGWYWLPPVVYGALIYYVSSQSEPETVVPGWFFEVSDKLVHAVEYGILAILCFRAFRYGANAAASWAMALAIIAAVLYGLTDEVHQAFVPLREADGWDLVADAAGAAAAVAVWRWLTDP